MINGSHHMRKSATTSGIYNLALSNSFMTEPATLFANNEAEASSFFKRSPMKMVLTLKLPSTLKTNRDTLDQDIKHTPRPTNQLVMNAHENSAKIYCICELGALLMPYLCSTKLLYHNLLWVHQIKCAFFQCWHSWPYIRAQLLWYWPTRYCSPTNACNLMLYPNISCQRPHNDENRIAHTLLRLDQFKCQSVIYNKQ